MASIALLTGGDARFYPFMLNALQSLIALGLDKRAQLGVLDLGLDETQIAELTALGCKIAKPHWTLSAPQPETAVHNIGLVARTALRTYFPGHDIYIWFDADAWAQTPEFFDRMIEACQATGAAIIREDGPGYRWDWRYMRWWIGNMALCYGPLRALRFLRRPVINIGIMALAKNAPHWDAWIKHYELALRKTGKINLDQHAFNAAIELDRLAATTLPARCNWIPTLSQPCWDAARKQLCTPDGMPLSVIHLAGPRKERRYRLHQCDVPGTLETPLTYRAVLALRDDSAKAAA